LLTHTLPLVLLAAVAFAAGIVVGLGPDRAERRLVSDYVAAWSHHDWSHMYSLLDAGSRDHVSMREFVGAYQRAASIATALAVAPVRVGSRRGHTIAVRMRVRTRLFGTLLETLPVTLVGSGSSVRVRFSPVLTFPGLRAGERLRRQARLPARGALLARDGTPLAQGPQRSSPIPDVASGIAGVLGPIPRDEARQFAAQGYPTDARVGLDGLERIFQPQLAGTPADTLLAGRRVLARRASTPGHDVKTTIDPATEGAVIAAIAGRYAGIVAMDPRTGAIRGVAGVGFSVLQPPGSTMKIITATGALEARIVKLTDTFPIRTEATIEGFQLQNAGGEACGGTFLNAFAVSCNAVFAPLGVRLGARRLVNVAERFGFNQEPPIPDVAESQIPSAQTIGDSLAVGASAIGQGRVQSSVLEMTDVAATIAMGGRRPIPTLEAGQPPRFARVTSAHVAHLVERMMVAVVQFGTGTAAQIPGVEVAGKTGTAELRNTADPNDPNANSPQNTDAWFVGYAPVGRPRIVVGALFPAQGAGGATAAPAVHDVLAATLSRH
jgi:cell division protein FtsI/penicillin-binding protein 2